MKKIIISLVLLTLAGCINDEEFTSPLPVEVPQNLSINRLVGIRLENNIVTERVTMNVKLPSDGIYRVKIKHGVTDKLISQEKLIGIEGDNILKIYVNVLDKSTYKLELTNELHKVISKTSFATK